MTVGAVTVVTTFVATGTSDPMILVDAIAFVVPPGPVHDTVNVGVVFVVYVNEAPPLLLLPPPKLLVQDVVLDDVQLTVNGV